MMQLEAQTFLRLTEHAGTLAFLDLETTGTRGDYNSILVGSIRPWRGKIQTFSVQQPGNDKRIVRELKERLEQADAWVTYYGKGFDVPILNTRLLKWGYHPVAKRPHVDMYYTLKYNLLTSRRSQAHLLEWLETPEQKLTISAELWNRVLHSFEPTMRILRRRCESDVRGLNALYDRTKHVISDIKR